MEAHYKKLNTELIAEVQSLRIKLGIMRKNEVILQAQLIDERAIQQKELRRAVNKFVQSLGISVGLGAADDNEITKTITDAEQSVPSSRPSCSTINRRSSVERRSMSLARSSSSLTLSPSDRRRRSTTRHSDDFQQHQEKSEHINITANQKTPPPRHLADLEDDESPYAEKGTTSPSTTEPITSDNINGPNLFLIVEEPTPFDISSTTESIASVSDDSSIYVPRNSRTISPSGRVLRDLSVNVPTITVGRGKEKHVRQELKVPTITFDTTNEDDGELSVQQVRHAVTSRSPAAGMKLTLDGGNTTMLMVTPRRSQFNGISDIPGCTSTPCPLTPEVTQKQRKGRKKKEKEQEEEEQESKVNSTYNSRPSRSCRPTTLTEPNLHTKLRNPTEFKKRKNSRPKSSS